MSDPDRIRKPDSGIRIKILTLQFHPNVVFSNEGKSDIQNEWIIRRKKTARGILFNAVQE